MGLGAGMNSAVQAMEALEYANWVRSKRTDWKETNQRMSYEAGLERVIALMEMRPTPPWVQTWRLREVLQSVPYMGRGKVKRFMVGSLMSEELRVGTMSDRQKDLVINWAKERIARHGR
jgi:hypothetical protein